MRAAWILLLFALATPVMAADSKPKKILLVGQGSDGHPATTHEFLPGVTILKAVLAQQAGVEVSTADGTGAWTEGPELINQADGVVLYVSEGAKWASADPRRLEALTKLAARGGGIVALHWGIGCKDDQYIDVAKKLWGGCHGGMDRKYKVLETELAPVADEPLVKGFEPLTIKDEFYYTLKFTKEGKVRPLMKATIENEKYVVAWAWERPDGGRSAGFSGLHFHENWKQATYRRLVATEVLWANKLEIPASGLKLDVADETYVLKK